MPVEKLLKPKINITELRPVKERDEIREQFEALKWTGLYDRTFGSWNWCMHKDQSAGFSKIYSRDQLLGILAEGLFDKKEARAQLNALKNTSLYDKDLKQWNYSMNKKDQELDSSECERYSASQLLGILVESLFDKKEAARQFKVLKQTELYDKGLKQWNYSMNKDQASASKVLLFQDQLLGILVESLFDKKEAEKQFIALKQTRVYNRHRRGWSWEYGAQNGYGHINASCQLLGVLVEGIFDEEEARGQLEALKGTSFYDKALKQWNNSVLRDQTISSALRTAQNQLLGILVEKAHEKKDFFPRKEEPLPWVRSF